jgi:acyl-CoA thioesterase FadM
MPLTLGIRYPWAGVRSLRRSPLSLFDESVVRMRVRPSDCDVMLHVNNGRYLSLMDIGRIDLAGRCGLIREFRKRGWHAVAGGATIRFRRELRLGMRYVLRTRCVGWDEGWSYFEQVFERDDGTLAARAYVKVAAMDEHGKRLESARMLSAIGIDEPSPPLPEGLLAWQSSEFG